MENDVVAKYQAILAKELEKWPMVEIEKYLQETNETNEQLEYSVGDVRGISIAKKLIETKADMTGVSLKGYKIVAPEEFVFVPVTSRNGEKISLAINNEGMSRIVSSTYVTFRTDDINLLPEYLFLQFKRPEFDRYARFNSWGSARETFTWEDMCRVKIPLPPIEVQRAYVKAYQGLSTLIEQNEALVKELEKTAQACIVECREKWPMVEIGERLKRLDIRNSDSKVKDVKGLSVSKQFREPTSKVDRENLASYKVVENGQFAFVQTTNNEKCLVVCLSSYKMPIVVSSVNEVFEIEDTTKLLPEYLFLQFKRPEFDRYARFNSWGSARETFTWEDMCRVKIPLPPIEVQRAIVALYTCAEEARKIASEAKELLKKACPAMVQSAAHHKVGVFQ